MPDKPPVPPKGYELTTAIKLPTDAKLSPDLEDRRNWGEVRKAVGQQGQDFKDYWRNMRNNYPDVHSVYAVLRDTIMGRNVEHPPVENDPVFAANTSQGPRVGDTKRFANDKIGVWDGHGWRAQ